eukprot:GHVQ01041330.1.p1 GENE.GHVQ01041330.1~~GHVQ01041330.1.p1  ORF type:complete len:185 (+),score=16.95 GHVQ01041330.1:378-932(+)
MKSTSSAPADIVLPSAVPLWQVSPHSLEWEPVSNLHLSAAELRELQLDPAKPVTATSIPVSVGMAYSTNRPSKPLTRKELCDNRSAGSKQSLSLRNIRLCLSFLVRYNKLICETILLPSLLRTTSRGGGRSQAQPSGVIWTCNLTASRRPFGGIAVHGSQLLSFADMVKDEATRHTEQGIERVE